MASFVMRARDSEGDPGVNAPVAPSPVPANAVPALAATAGSSNAFVRALATETLVRLDTAAARSAAAGLLATETAFAEKERQAALRPLSIRQALAPIPPTQKNLLALSDVWSQTLRLATGQEVLVAVFRRDPKDSGEPYGAERPDLLRVFFQTPEGYRRVLSQEESASQAEYAATVFSRSGRSFLHLVRRVRYQNRFDDSPVWRLDRVFEVTGHGLAPIALQASPTACGAWLPHLDETETIGVVFEFGKLWRFGWHRKAPGAGDDEAQKPDETRWLGELALATNGTGLVIARCALPVQDAHP